MLTDLHGKILYANKAIETKKGFAPQEVIGKTAGEVWGRLMPESFYKRMWKTIHKKREPFLGRARNLNKQGKVMYENLHISPILNTSGDIEYYLEVEPEFNSSKEEEQFENEFLAIMAQRMCDPAKVLEMVWQWSSENKHIDKEDYRKMLPLTECHNELPILLEDAFLSYSQFNQIEDMQLTLEAKRHPEAFEALYKKYRTKVFNYFFYRVDGHSQVAEDLMQETFARAFSALERFEFKHCTYLSYLLMVAHNLLLNHYRSKKTISLEDVGDLPIKTENFSQKADLSMLWDRIRELPQNDQNILAMKYHDDLTIRSISKKLGKTENAVKLVLCRARKKLKAEVNGLF